MEWNTFSPRLALGISIFAIGLIVLALLVVVALVWMGRRPVQAHEDQIIRLLRNSAIPLAIQLIIRAIDLAFVAVLYRVIQPTAVGNYDFATLVTTLILGTIAEWGLNIYLTREVARDPGSIERLFGTTLVVRLGLAALVIPISLGVVAVYDALYAAGVINYGFDAQGTLLMLLFACTVLPGAVSAAVSAVFMALEQPIVPATVGLLTNILSALLKLAAIVFGFGIVGVAWAALLATVVSAAMFGGLLVRNVGRLRIGFDRTLARTMLWAGFPLMLNALLLAVFFRFDTTIIRAERSVAELAAYGAAYKWVALTQILPPILINAIFPMFSRHAVGDLAALRRSYNYTVRLLIMLALPIAAAISLLAPWCILVLSGVEQGQQYLVLGAPALAILIWYLPLSYVNGVTQYVLIALDRPRTITVAFGLAALFNIGFNVVFVPRYGIQAAAVATVLSEIVLFVPLWRALRSHLDPAPVWHRLWQPLLATGGMALGMLLLSRVHVWLSVACAPIVFGGLLLAVGAIQEDDRRLARRVFRRSPRAT